MLRLAVKRVLCLSCVQTQPDSLSRISCRSLMISTAARNYWEPDKKSGYKTKIKTPLTREALKESLVAMPAELVKFKEEIVSKLRCDNLTLMLNGDYEIVWKFNSREIVKSWVVTSDSDHNEGKSEASFDLGANQKAVFRGVLSTELPKDGIIKDTGYCNIRSPRNKISFKRARPYEWQLYTHLVLAVRGDGRIYQMIINMDREYDLQWNDQYNYPLYTRGGPYWQLTKIPFSKFYLSAKGRIQDKQEAIQLHKVSALGITLADANPGPFNLEIDFIALVYDESHKDTFEYEMYPVSSSTIG